MWRARRCKGSWRTGCLSLGSSAFRLNCAMPLRSSLEFYVKRRREEEESLYPSLFFSLSSRADFSWPTIISKTDTGVSSSLFPQSSKLLPELTHLRRNHKSAVAVPVTYFVVVILVAIFCCVESGMLNNFRNRRCTI
jgi:hypothetical protein